MIPVLLRQLLPRLLLVAVAALGFGALEPAFHQHDGEVPAAAQPYLQAIGVAATLANLAGLSVILLLAGFISTDRRRGYYRMYFAHPTRPLAFYGLRWALAVALSVAAAAAFLVFGQGFAWGEFRGGLAGLLLAALSAVAYGGLMAFLSAALPRGDAGAAIALFVVAYFWRTFRDLGARPLPAPLGDALTLLLPPLDALERVFEGLVWGAVPWDAAAFVAGYGVFWGIVAAVLVKVREWP